MVFRKSSHLVGILCGALLAQGCLLSRLVDRSFIGMTVRTPKYQDRKGTGFFLLPITAVLDLATFPIQAIIVIIMGDYFPWKRPVNNQMAMLEEMPAYQKLSEAVRERARRELSEVLLAGDAQPNVALLLDATGHWTKATISDSVRQQLISRAEETALRAAPIALAQNEGVQGAR